MNPELVLALSEFSKAVGIPAFILLVIVWSIRPYLFEQTKQQNELVKLISAQNELLRGMRQSMDAILHLTSSKKGETKPDER